jgi:hypothetical protein
VVPPWQLATHLAFLADEIYLLTARQGRPVRVSWEAAVAGRAALLGLRRRGQTSPNGSCRLLRTRDGWVALNLPRPADTDLIPALTGRAGSDAWTDAETLAGATPAREFAARARLLGLATAPLVFPPAPLQSPLSGHARGDRDAVEPRWEPRSIHPADPWLVVDLSALWAGPLATRLLAEAGAAVTKLESVTRPDGARATPDFYTWLHAPAEQVVSVDLATAAGREAAAALVDAADVVIEASRPRALEHLGLGPDDRPARAGRVWLSITGHGRDSPGRDWIAFGDDAAVAGGLVARDERGDPVFCGDAIADPLTGLTGALAVLEAREQGGGVLIDLAMSRVAAAAVEAASGAGHPVDERGEVSVVEADGRGGWLARTGGRQEPVRDGPGQLSLLLPVRA